MPKFDFGSIILCIVVITILLLLIIVFTLGIMKPRFQEHRFDWWYSMPTWTDTIES